MEVYFFPVCNPHKLWLRRLFSDYIILIPTWYNRVNDTERSQHFTLHNVSYKYTAFNDAITGEHKLFITVTDTFDFTEFKNPFTQGNLKSAFLWAMNDIAYIDSKWGLLDPVKVKIVVVVSVEA